MVGGFTLHAAVVRLQRAQMPLGHKQEFFLALSGERKFKPST
jgi:hypothetical protein